jgi:hypothetical protein
MPIVQFNLKAFKNIVNISGMSETHGGASVSTLVHAALAA